MPPHYSFDLISHSQSSVLSSICDIIIIQICCSSSVSLSLWDRKSLQGGMFGDKGGCGIIHSVKFRQKLLSKLVRAFLE